MMTRQLWSRRDWLTSTAEAVSRVAALVTVSQRRWPFGTRGHRGHVAGETDIAVRAAGHARRWSPDPWHALAQQGVDAARTAGASYADARLTRTVYHWYLYGFHGVGGESPLWRDVEYVGVGVRALVDGYWGFAAAPYRTVDDVVRLARDAVQQARVNATGGTPRTVELGHSPVVTGTWVTPIRIDPFGISIEEKLDAMEFWSRCADQAGGTIQTSSSWHLFVRQERVLATSDGSLVAQTLYETGGNISLGRDLDIERIGMAGKGWELFEEAQIPDQIVSKVEQGRARKAFGQKPLSIGRYTLVCDGQTMAALVGSTLGVATQLDRALGYEANANGTSFVDDPLGMVGHFPVAAPSVTVTANRSAPGQLATVQWDDEGVVPDVCTLIKDGVLTDFQTTREQAAWLAPYYQSRGRSVRSHGYAASNDALSITMQHMPNLALEPSATTFRVDDLIADVKEGILIRNGWTWQLDAQARNGLLGGVMQQIRNGRLGAFVNGGIVAFNTVDLFKHVMAVGGPPSQAVVGGSWVQHEGDFGVPEWSKGQPPQSTSHTVCAVAATIANQSVIDPMRKR